MTQQDNGLAKVRSRYSVAETLDRLEKSARSRGLTVFARIDHDGEAQKVGLKMPPTQVVILGSPKAGTPLMIAAPTLAIDLPLKALAWEDQDGQVWVAYNTPEYLQWRHGVPAELVTNIAGLGALVEAAAQGSAEERGGQAA